MIAVSITVVTDGGDARGRVVEATVSDVLPVAELLPHLVDALPGEHWRLVGPGGVLRPELGLGEAGVRPGERLELTRDAVPAPPPDTVEQLSTVIPPSPAVHVAAVAAAGLTVALPPLWAGTPAWHPLEVTERARSVFDGTGDPGGVTATVCTVFTVFAAVAVAACSLHDRRLTPVAALLAFGSGLQVNVLTGCVLAACAVWRSGPERVFTVCLALAAAVNFWPGVTVLAGMVVLVFSGQLALGVAGVPLPRIPATGLFHGSEQAGPVQAGSVKAGPGGHGEAGRHGIHDRSDRSGRSGGRHGQAVEEGGPGNDGHPTTASALTTHAALVLAACTVICAGVFQLIPPGSRPDWQTVAGGLAVAAAGLSARGCRPVHAVSVTLTATLVFSWTLMRCPGLWPVLAPLPVVLPLIRVRSPLVGRVTDVVETVAFAVAVPLLISTTGVFGLVRGLG